ncbi:cation diffusion facilitator family transporter [Pseudoalteromonas tunicata]|jgi:ferrous-iron efflux pump FieF|uniref:Cation-efflux pump FieF n=2 Tax=Pseudoalteromonas tunicata TaxID=314281 RepID=A4C798_9GAMM|nr:cation diffusion facilitator family transporter [Pseudoalteromonas tunicata]AXT31368.1 cation diffusion facilitator family transporter [Pseudoalteromonas tunicata]EAR29852.1 putative transport protein [Pseudoalteromonas tunicata D2]
MSKRDYAFWVKLASWSTMALVSLMILTKVWAWLTTGSAAMLGSLTDSLMDITATLMNFFVLRYALRPADDDHRFGHGKAESLAGLGQAAFIAGSGCLLAFHGVERLINPSTVSNTGIGIGVSVFAIVCTLAIVLVQNQVIKQTNSIAIKADSIHYKGDLILNASVILAMVLAYYGWLQADGFFAIAVAGYLLFNAWQVALESADHLMDKELPEEEKSQILSWVCSHEQVHGAHDLRTRQAGQIKFVQLHIELDDHLPLVQAHKVTDEIVAILTNKMSGQIDVLIHQDPVSVVLRSKNS